MYQSHYSDVVNTTTDNRIYKIALKNLREARGEISCCICPYHGGENHNNDNWRMKNWKWKNRHTVYDCRTDGNRVVYWKVKKTHQYNVVDINTKERV